MSSTPPPPEPEPVPTLPDELLEEVFLRLPPDEPACLVRASLASKLWLGLLTGPAFRGRYSEHHGAPPMLGFFYCRLPYSKSLAKETEPLFISTTKFQARISSEAQGWRSYGCNALDCRHGRVVLGDNLGIPDELAKLTVSDPMTGRWWDMGAPAPVESYGAAVVCAVTGCDHLACHDGPFRVVFVGLKYGFVCRTASVWLSSPEPSSDLQLAEWGKVVSGVHIPDDPFIKRRCPVLIDDALHFMLVYIDDEDDEDHVGILKYNLSSNCLSLIDAPLGVFGASDATILMAIGASDATILMAMEDGTLGFAYVNRLTLYVWSRELGSDGEASWTEWKVINLGELLPFLNLKCRHTLVGSVEGRDIIFVNTELGIYEINLMMLQWKKIWKREKIRTLVPYMSVYNQARRTVM